MRLSAKASALLAVLVAGFLSAAVFTATNYSERVLRENIFANLDNQAEHASWDIQQFLADSKQETEAVAAGVPSQAMQARDLTKLSAYLKRMHEILPRFESGIFLMDKDGLLLDSYPPAPPAMHNDSLAQHDFFKRAVTEQQTVISEPHLSQRTGMPVITFATPIKDEQGGILGVLGGAVDLFSVHALGNLRSVKIGKSGFIGITDTKRRVILHPQNRWVLATIPEGKNPMLESILSGSTMLHGEGDNSEGIAKVMAAHWVQGVPWLVWVTIPQAEVYQPVHNIRAAAVGLTLISLLLAVPLGVLGMKGVTRPLTILAESVSQLTASLDSPGELADSSTEKNDPHLTDLTRRRDEIGVLASAFLHLASRLKLAFSSLIQARDEAERADWAKSEYLAVMSHGIRTPLTSVLGALEALRETPLTEEQKEFLQLARKSGSGLLSTLSNILDLSRIDSDTVEPVEEPFLLGTVLDTCRAVFEKRAALKGLSLKCHCSDALPSILIGDQARLRQMLFNLIANAIKYTDSGRVTVEAVPGSGPGRVRFKVSDTGRGMAPEKLATMVQSLSAKDGKPLPGRQGPGLGLSIVSRLVSLMGGDITLESMPGKGTTVAVDLILPPADAPGEYAQETPSACPQDNSTGCAILLAEDDRTNQVVIRKLLEKRGFMVLCANDGRQALDILNETEVAAVLMDVNMPVMGGEEATRLIRAKEGKAGLVPIIALTADALEGDRERFLAMGMDDYVSKPVDMVTLMKVLGRWV